MRQITVTLSQPNVAGALYKVREDMPMRHVCLFNKFIYYIKVNFCTVPFTNNVHNSSFGVQYRMETVTTSVMHKNVIVYCENHVRFVCPVRSLHQA